MISIGGPRRFRAIRAWRVAAGRLAAAAVGTMLVAACASMPALPPTGPAEPRPPAPPSAAMREGSALGPSDERSELAQAIAAQSSGALAVEFATPQGQTSGPVEISLVFSKPMRALGAAPDEPRPTVTLRPAVNGSWQWLGSSALRFNLPGELPEARELCGEVPAGTRALDGSTLAEPFRWCFETTRPRLVGAEPRGGAEGVSPETPLVLAFNQPIAPDELARRVRIVATKLRPSGEPHGHAAAVAWTLAKDEGKRFELAAPLGWPRSSEIRVAIDGSLRSRLGELPMGSSTELAFRTIPPLAVKEIRCAPAAHEPRACDPFSPTVVIETTTPVGEEALRNVVRVEPLEPDAEWTLSATEPDESEPSLDWYEHPTHFRLEATFAPGKSYRITVGEHPRGEPLRDEHGQELTRPVRRLLRMADEPPRVRFQAEGTFWPAAEPKQLPMSCVNVAESTLRALPLGLPEVLGIAVGAEPSAKVARGRVELRAGARNETAVTVVSIGGLLGAEEPRGPVRVLAQYRGRTAQSRETTHYDFQLTDLGLLARTDREQALVWVTSLGQGTPIAGVELAIYGIVPGQSAPTKPIATATTDLEGLASVPLHLVSLPEDLAVEEDREDAPRLLVVARHGKDWAHHEIPIAREPEPAGALFCERGIYRPGEEVALKGIVRLPHRERLVVPAGRVVKMRVEDAERRVVSSWSGRVSRYGTFSWRPRLPADGPRGVYFAVAEVAGGTLRERFFVVDYRPAESTAEAELDRSSYVRGDSARCSAHGEMLYGAPMARAKVTFVAERSTSSHAISELYDWTVNDEATRASGPRRTLVAQSVAELDAHGRSALRVPLAFADQAGPELVTCSVEITDHNRQARGASASALVHPADAYAAIREFRGPDPLPGDRIVPEVLVVTPTGERIARAVRVEVLHRHHVDGTTVEDRLITACELTSGAAPVTCPTVVPTAPIAPHDSIVVRATTQDARGNVARASTAIEIVRERPAPDPAPSFVPMPLGPPPLYLHVGLEGVEQSWGHSFDVGDHARVWIKSPFPEPALALVTLERESVLWRRVVRLPARTHAMPNSSALLDIPITPALVPNVDLRVTVVHGARSEQEVLPFVVKPRSRTLALTLQACAAGSAKRRSDAGSARAGTGPRARSQRAARQAFECMERARFEPGDELDLALEVRDASGAPAAAEITLWAADEGSLMLAYYGTPDPARELFREREPLVTGADARDDVVSTWLQRHRTHPPQVRMGATSVSGPERADFRQTVFFEPSLVTDASGRLVHRVRLPDGLTSYRIMAVATALDDEFGAGELNVTTSKPLMVRPTLPRVIRVGDELEASAVVTTNDLEEPEVRVGVRAEGLVPVGSTSRRASLERGVPQEVRFRMRAGRAGDFSIRFDATALDRAGKTIATDAVVARARVEAPTVIETAVVHGETRTAIAERLGALEGVRADVGGLEISLQATPLASLTSGMEQLLEYPYGCTEQLVSRLVPLVALGELARSLGVPLPSGSADPARAVGQIVAAQRADGGFGFWPGSSRSLPWLSSYALWGLDEADRRSVPVPAEAHARAREHVERQLRETLPLAAVPSPPHGGARLPRTTPSRSVPAPARSAGSAAALAEAAFALDVLATGGRPDHARMAMLAERHAELLPFAKALLLHALATTSPAAPHEPLLRELESLVRLDGPVARVVGLEPAHRADDASRDVGPLSELFDSPVRTSAMTLRALASVDPHHPLLTPLALGLLADRQRGRWRSTQEAAWALLALDAALRALPAPAQKLDAQVFLGPKLLAEASFTPAERARRVTTGLPMSELLALPAAPLVFASQAGGSLYYEARLRFARRETPGALDAGLFLTKTVRPLAQIGQPPGPPLAGRELTLQAGQVALCELILVSPSPRFAVVVDDPLPGGLEPVDLALAGGGDWLAGLESSPATRRELRDDRVLYFVDELAPGVHRFRYLARATTPGRFLAPSSRAEEMYVPETFSRTAPGWVKVTAP